MTTTALAKRQQQLTRQVWEMIGAVAPIMKDSRLFGVATDSQAAAIMAKGFELGLPLTAAFEFIVVISGKPTLSPRGALALVQQSGLLEAFKIEETKDASGAPYACKVTMKRSGGIEYTSEFTMDDARRASLVKPGGGWESYPANMLKWRAVGFCIDMTFSDVTGGLERADEFGANIDTAGNMVEGVWTVSTSTASSQPARGVLNTAPAPVPTLQDLVLQFGAEAVMAANNGMIPGSDVELAAVAAALGL
jgi:hypothetical protein